MDQQISLKLGRWQQAFADDFTCSAVIADPPYGSRTHEGSANMEQFDLDGHAARRSLTYAHWTPDDVREFVAFWAPRTRGWMACMTSDDLIPVWRAAYATAGRLDFAPVPCLWHRPRMSGDGPGSGTVYLMVARPREKRFLSWGSLPCWYGPIFAPRATDPDHHIGGKPLSIMRSIVRDYSRPGDLVCDPCAGGATTLLAAAMEGRRAVGSEMDADTFAKAQARLAKGYTLPMFVTDSPRLAVQSPLDLVGVQP